MRRKENGTRRWSDSVSPWTLFIVATLFLVGFFWIPTPSTEESAKGAPHRRLQERIALSPEALATVLLAHELAQQGAATHEGGHHHRAAVDSFQAMRAAAVRQKDGPGIEPDAPDLPTIRHSNDWRRLDPLRPSLADGDTTDRNPNDLKKPQVEYLGVMVDGGRHYFPLDWWKQLILHLQRLHFNMIQFRLTDDELLTTSGGSTARRYSHTQLKDLVALARDHGITMIPDVNLPLRAAAWAGSPGLIVPCPNVICDTAHYVPLNLEHPNVEAILVGVLREVLEIFDSPPLLQIGGSGSLRDADECLEEAGMGGTQEYWEKWEGILRSVLETLEYPPDQVIRLQTVESTDLDGDDGGGRTAKFPLDRVGGHEHYWISLPNSDSQPKGPKLLPGAIVSTGLDLGVDDDDNALAIYTKSLEIMQLPHRPKAIVVSTLQLSTDLWLERNVLTRLIAVAMGASLTAEKAQSPLQTQLFDSQYAANCRQLLPETSQALCQLKGHTVGTPGAYLDRLAKDTQEWRQTICKRLAVGTYGRVFQPYMTDRILSTKAGESMFWRNFHRLPKPYAPEFQKKGAKKRTLVKQVQQLQRQVQKAGVIFDLSNSLVSAVEVQILLLAYVAPLGFDMLQLRLADDFAFAVQLENTPAKLSQSHWNDSLQTPIPRIADFQQVIDAASEWNMEVFPEISITTNAGGWVNGGFLVQCPERYCKYGTGIPNDIRDANFLPLVYAVLYELRQTFGGSSPYLHLGHDERVDNLKCFQEHGLNHDEDPPFGVFEKKLQKFLLMMGVVPENVIRYDNLEQLTYEDRVGGITHYHVADEPGSLPDIREGEPFWLTADLMTANIFSIYKDARRMVEVEPLAVLGEIRTLDRNVWKEQHMGIRLIAFMLGLSDAREDKKPMAQQDFVKKVIDICRVVDFPDYKEDKKCEAAMKLLNSEKGEIKGDDDAIDSQPTPFPDATIKFREGLCEKFTRTQTTMAMRESYVITEKS